MCSEVLKIVFQKVRRVLFPWAFDFIWLADFCFILALLPLCGGDIVLGFFVLLYCTVAS